MGPFPSQSQLCSQTQLLRLSPSASLSFLQQAMLLDLRSTSTPVSFLEKLRHQPPRPSCPPDCSARPFAQARIVLMVLFTITYTWYSTESIHQGSESKARRQRADLAGHSTLPPDLLVAHFGPYSHTPFKHPPLKTATEKCC